MQERKIGSDSPSDVDAFIIISRSPGLNLCYNGNSNYKMPKFLNWRWLKEAINVRCLVFSFNIVGEVSASASEF